jgi:Tol biopolymer transport system component
MAQDVRGGARRVVIERRTPLVFPRYSPDGRRIALQGRNSRGDMQLFVMDANGSKVTAVTDGAGDLNIMPQWSADGETLYFYQVRPTQTFRRLSVSSGASRGHRVLVLRAAI